MGEPELRSSARNISGSTASSPGRPIHSSFPVQLFHTSRPGTLDTSLISTDNINNPRTMNAFYALMPRMVEARRWGKETLAGGGLNNKQFNDYVHEGPLTQFFQAPDTVWSPRVLKDGSDSVGALGALNRVYLNIGLFSEEWLLHFRALVGGTADHAHRNCSRQQELRLLGSDRAMQTPDMALFFLGKSTAPHHLKDAPGGDAYLTKDKAQAGARQGRLCRALRALPFQQDSCAGARARSRRLLRQGLPGLLEQVLGMDQDRRLQGARCARSSSSTISWTTITFPPSSAFRSPCCKPTPAVRWRPMLSAATSGTTSRRRPTKTCRRWAASLCITLTLARPALTTCRREDVAIRARRR